MSGIDYRALCAELLADYEEHLYRSVLADRARTALAQPEPEAVGLSPEEVEDLCEEHCFNVEGYESIECLQGLINDALARYGHQPAPPAEGEVEELVAWLSDEADQYDCIKHISDASRKLRRAADLLEQRHPEPVPVALSERPPGPKGLNDKGECWEWDPTSDAWVLLKPIGWTFRDGPWLPFNALPLPSGEVKP